MARDQALVADQGDDCLCFAVQTALNIRLIGEKRLENVALHKRSGFPVGQPREFPAGVIQGAKK
jgi:hypothetical protein